MEQCELGLGMAHRRFLQHSRGEETRGLNDCYGWEEGKCISTFRKYSRRGVKLFPLCQYLSDIKTHLTQRLKAGRGEGICCRCFSEKFLESLGGTPGLFSKKDMSKEGGALQHSKFFKKSIILITECLLWNPIQSNILYWIMKCVKVFRGEKIFLHYCKR